MFTLSINISSKYRSVVRPPNESYVNVLQLTRSDLKWKMDANNMFHSILHHKTKLAVYLNNCQNLSISEIILKNLSIFEIFFENFSIGRLFVLGLPRFPIYLII